MSAAKSSPAGVNPIEAFLSPLLFRSWFKDLTTWKGPFAFIKTLYGLPKGPEDLGLARACTTLSEFPLKPYKEGYVIAPRRSGKSSAAALIAAWTGISRDWTKLVAPGERAWIFVIAVDRAQASQIKGYVSGLFSLTPTLKSMVTRETREALELRTGCSISVKTCSFRSVRGYSCAAVLLDEAAFYRSDESANPDREVVAAVRPALANLDGLLLVLSTPYARQGVLYDAYRRWYGQPGGPLVWKASSRMMNPTISEEVIARAMEEDPAGARSEWLAEFREDLEMIFSLDAVERCVVPGRGELPPVKGFEYCGFCDPSGGRSDSFTLGISHRSRSGRLVLDVLREARPPFRPEDVVGEYAQLLRSYGLSELTADAYAGEWVSAAFLKHGLAVVQAPMPKSDLYLNLLPHVSNGGLELPDSKRLVTQLVGLERRTRTGGRDKVDHGPGGHDDLANSAAGALVLAAEGDQEGELLGVVDHDIRPFGSPGVEDDGGSDEYAQAFHAAARKMGVRRH